MICQAEGPVVGAPDQVSPAFCVPRKLAVSLGPLPALICMQGPCPVDWIRTRGASGSDSQSWGPGGRAGTLPSPLCPTSSCPGGADTAALPPSSAPGPPGTCSPISAGVLGRGTRDPGTAASPGVVRTGRLGLGLWAGPRGPSQSRGEGTALGAPAGPRGVVPWKSLLSLCVITLARVLHGASTQATSAGLDAPFPWQREGPRAGERRQPPGRVGKSRVGPPARSTGRRGPGAGRQTPTASGTPRPPGGQGSGGVRAWAGGCLLGARACTSLSWGHFLRGAPSSQRGLGPWRVWDSETVRCRGCWGRCRSRSECTCFSGWTGLEPAPHLGRWGPPESLAFPRSQWDGGHGKARVGEGGRAAPLPR